MEVKDKKYYRIREVSELFNIPITTIRYWDSVFPQLKPERTPSGQRRYTLSDIDIIERIKFLLREKGMSLEYAKKELKKYRKYPPRHSLPCASHDDVIRLLREVKERTDDAHVVVRIEAIERYLTNEC